MPKAMKNAAASTNEAESAHSRSDRAAALIDADMRAIEARLAERMDSPVGAIPQVGAHLLDAGGKRLRPLLAILAARAGGAPLEHAIAVGCAAELIHTATLYHDDVVDDGRVRRGRPAARMVFGNGLVVLVGDFCLARALETVALTGSLPMVRSLASTVTEMAEGEVAPLVRAAGGVERAPRRAAALADEVVAASAQLPAGRSRDGLVALDRAQDDWSP